MKKLMKKLLQKLQLTILLFTTIFFSTSIYSEGWLDSDGNYLSGVRAKEGNRFDAEAWAQVNESMNCELNVYLNMDSFSNTLPAIIATVNDVRVSFTLLLKSGNTAVYQATSIKGRKYFKDQFFKSTAVNIKFSNGGFERDNLVSTKYFTEASNHFVEECRKKGEIL
tara:strand:+ start:134 stop:634 length:501 start_codon:yes stop_codon:yes gene_type:complete